MTPEGEALERELIELSMKALALAQPQAPQEVTFRALLTPPIIPCSWPLPWPLSFRSLVPEKQQLLLELPETRLDALQMMHQHDSHELQVLELRGKIASQAQSELSKEQREYLLRQQMRVIQDEIETARAR